MFTRRTYNYIMDNIIKDKTITNTEKFFMVKTIGRWFQRDIHNFNPLTWCKEWNKRKQPALSLSDLDYQEESSS